MDKKLDVEAEVNDITSVDRKQKSTLTIVQQTTDISPFQD